MTRVLLLGGVGDALRLARRLGFTSLSLHTASTRTASTVPGVPHEEALRLRLRLTELGESRGAGL